MKKLIKLIAVIMITFTASAQVQNLDFEQWDYAVSFGDPAQNRPTGWICSNRWFGYEEAGFSDRFVRPVDSLAQNNNYALSLFTFYNYMKDSAVQTTSIDYRPTSLKGFFKYHDNFIVWSGETYIDTAQVVVTLTKWNALLSRRDTIGRGKFSTYASTDTFTPFQADIEYFSAEQPDMITIFLDPSFIGRDPNTTLQNDASGGRSIFTVDNLSLERGVASVNQNDVQRDLFLYPNPATDNIKFKRITGELQVSDLTGKIVISETVTEKETLDVSHLSGGTYLMMIKTEEGNYNSKFIKF